MTFPTVTITVTGTDAGPVDPAEAEKGLHMMYVQAVKGDKRQQWVVFPPAVKELGVPEDKIPAGAPSLLLHRTQEFPGNRSKWFHFKQNAPSHLTEQMKSFEADGWVLSEGIVVTLEKDDYLAVWEGKTPHKALRAVDRAITPFGLTVK